MEGCGQMDGLKKPAHLPKLDGSMTEKSSKVPYFPRRLVVVILATMCTLWSFSITYSLSVAIVAMTTTIMPNFTSTDECPWRTNFTMTELQKGELEWSSEIQGMALGSFYYGYLTTQVFAGFLAERFGPRWVVGGAMVAVSVLAVLTPEGARLSPYVLIGIRICQGLAKGLILPSVPVILEKWGPVHERSRMSALVTSGTVMGIASSQVLAGLLCDSGLFGGWPSAFYVMGFCGLLTAAVWMIFFSNSPGVHPSISRKEREYIEQNTQDHPAVLRTPWVKILTSFPVWGIVFANTAASWGIYSMSSLLPTYMKQILHFNIKDSGLLSAAPIALTAFFTNIGGVVSDMLLRNSTLKTVTIRRIMVGLGGFSLAGLTVAAGFTGCNIAANCACLILAVGLCGLLYAGLYVNPLDIAPHHAGVLFGIANTIATIPGIVAPPVATYIIGDKPSVARWRTVFLVSGGVCTFGTLFFVLFAAGKIQKWAIDEIQDDSCHPHVDCSDPSPNVLKLTHEVEVKQHEQGL